MTKTLTIMHEDQLGKDFHLLFYQVRGKFRLKQVVKKQFLTESCQCTCNMLSVSTL